jgi:hypothetical protein
MATVLGYSNQIDFATLSGGSWNASYPLTNLKNRYLNQGARSNNLLAASTVIDIDLGQLQRIGLVALVNHNLTELATVRVVGSSSASMSPVLYDSGAEAVYRGSDFAKTFPWVECRYWRITISDPTNTNGFVSVGRVFIGWRFAPTNNIDWSPSISVESDTQVKKALGGPEFFEERPNRRVWQGKWSWLNDYEAYTVYLAIQRATDISREVYLIEDDQDADFRHQRCFLGRFRQLSAIEFPYVNQHSVGIEIGELL